MSFSDGSLSKEFQTPVYRGEILTLNFGGLSSLDSKASAIPPSKIETISDANRFLTKKIQSGLASVGIVPLLRVQTNHDPFLEIRAVLCELNQQDSNLYSWCSRLMQDTSSGNLEGSLRSGHILIETPPCGRGPYLFLYLTELEHKREGQKGNMVGIYMYSDGEFEMVNSTQNQYTEFIERKLCDGNRAHIKWNWEKAKAVYNEVVSIQQLLREGSVCETSDITMRINNCSRRIRELGLELRRDFHLKAIVWLDELLREAHEYLPIRGKTTARQLLDYHRFDWLNDPHMLEKQIAEARALLNEEVIRQQQEQNVQLQRTIVEQQENLKMIQEQSLRLTQRLADEADRDRLATRAREEANARLTQLSASIARQSLELARETRRESRTMRGIGWVTMGFLPATFVASFFGMNFFNVIQEKPYFDEAAKNIWIFFAFALPISAIVLWQFYRWDAKSERDALNREETQHENKAAL